jgi:fibronectin type 3 domain-containing protein
MRNKANPGRNPISLRKILNRKSFRPLLELLECRLAPANVDVLSYHYDALLSGNNNQETILTPANVNPANFGLLFRSPVDGQIYASPLYKANLMIGGVSHNVAFVATEHDSVYGFDADTGAQLWQRNFLNPGAGVTSVPSADTSGNVFPEYGITGTPVISGNIMYVVAQTKEVVSGTAHYVDKLHAIDITTGADRATNAVVTIGDSLGNDTPSSHNTLLSVPGVGAGSDGTTVKFNAWRQLQRPALALLNGVVYVGFAGYNDQGPYHGWVVGYRATDLALQGFINFSPNARAAGIWQSGGGFATDGTNLYFATGNTFSQTGHPGFSPSEGNFGETVVKLTPAFTVADYFTPFNWQALDNGDLDLGSGGTMLLPDAVGSATHPHLLVETGKTGNVYLIDRANMGHNVPLPGPDTNIVQTFGPLGGPGVWGNPSFFQDGDNTGIIYYHGQQTDLQALRITNGMITGRASRTNFTFGYPGGQPIISSNGRTNAIAWDMQVDGATGNTILHAYNAINLAAQELYHSDSVDGSVPASGQFRDRPGGPVKFTPPTVTNGHVLLGTDSTFAIYGLFDSHSVVPAAPMSLAGTGLTDTQIRLNWTNPTPNNATGIKIERSTNQSSGFVPVAITGRNATTFTDSGLDGGTVYYYRIQGTNQAGSGAYSLTASAATRIPAPVLALPNVSHAEIDLSWTPTGNGGYRVERSFNGQTFAVVFTTASPAQNTYFDTDVANQGTYQYRVTAINMNPPDNSTSTIASVSNFPGIDHSTGFVSHGDLTANGNALFAEGAARLTTNVGEVGTIFTNQRQNVGTFTTTFTFRLHDFTNPPADGFTFIIQGNGPTALGGAGGALGYAGIPNSVAVKFDIYDNAGEGTNSTGIFSAGRVPTVRDQGLPPNPTPDIPDISLTLDGLTPPIDLKNQNVKRVTLSYDGTILHEDLTDTVTGGHFTHDYAVNIPLLIGNTAAFVGFGGGTGGLSAIQDIQTWTFTPGVGVPGAPTSALAAINGADIALNWTSNSLTEAGFIVDRSDNRTDDFREIARVSAPRFTDTNAPPGNFYYRVRAFNQAGNSALSNVANIIIGNTTPFTDHTTGFSSHGDLQLNDATVAGTRLRLTDGGGGEARTAWTTTRVGIVSFNTSFIFQDQNVNGSADGITFAIQNNDPGQVGGAGGCLGYCGIGHSVAVMFDLYSGGNHHSTTNLLLNGNKVGAIDMGPAGIVLGSNHPLRCDLTYDITQLTLTETVTDTITGAVFRQTYSVNIPQVVAGDTAFVGFTGGTGGETAIQDILSWNGRFLGRVQPVSHVSLTAANSTAGMSIPVVATAQDAFNAVKADYRGTVHFTSTDSQAILPGDYQFAPGDNGVHTFSGVVLRTAGPQRIIAQDTNQPTSYIRGNVSTTVTAAAASQLLLAYPSPTTAGQLHFFTITAQDPYHNTAPTYRGRVHLTSGDGQAILSDDANFTADDNGVHTFAAVLFTGPTQTITATDTQTGSITGTQTLTIVGAEAHSIVVSDFPSPARSGVSRSFTVTAYDLYGNIATGYLGTVSFTSSDSRATLPDPYQFQPGDNSRKTFSGSLRTLGSQSITVTDSANGFSSTQAGISIVPAQFVVTEFSSPTNAGAAGVFRVSAADSDGNTLAGYTGTVHFTSSDGQATLPDDYAFTPGDQGTHLFPAILRTAGPQSIAAADTVDNGLVGAQTGIDVRPLAVAGSFTITDFQSPIRAGAPETFTVHVFDPYGNAAPGYRGTISFSTTDVQASLPDNYTFTAADNGVHTFTAAAIFRTRGTQTLFVTDTGNGATGAQDIVVTPDAAVRLRVFGFPSPTTVGDLQMFTVTAVDQFNNEGAIYTGTVHFTSSDDFANLPNDTAFVPADNGTRIFYAIFNTAGIQSLTATDTVDGSITGTQDNIEVDSGPSAPGGGRGGRSLVAASVATPAPVPQFSTIVARPASSPTAREPQSTQQLIENQKTVQGSAVRHQSLIDQAFITRNDGLLYGAIVDDLVRARIS